MSIQDTVLEIPQMYGIAMAAKREPQSEGGPWPADTVIVSPDSHMIEADCWISRFPEHLKAQAPRIEFKNGQWLFSVGGRPMVNEQQGLGACESMECRPGFSDVAARLKDLDAEGVDKELVFPQRLMGLYTFTDIDLREEIFDAYNESIAERCARAPGRLYPVMIPNYWDMAKARASVERCARLGARALMTPINPRKDVNGDPINYGSPKMDPLYEAIADSGIPLAFHIGEALPSVEPGFTGAFVLTQLQGFRANWGQLTFGGVFDRHPRLKVVFVEAGICWVASMIYDADMIYQSFPDAMNPKLNHSPSWYWKNHCYATFITDPAGLELLHRIGPDTVMWSSDYPHLESSLGYTRSSIQAVFDATDVETAQKILGKTAVRVFNMTD